MAYEDRHDVVFQELFKNNPAGLALYKPFSSTKLKPGACGYFDYDGDWQTITDLTDPAVLEAGGWTRAIVETEPTQMEEYWPAMVSKGVEAFSGSIDVNVAGPGVGGGVKVGYKVQDEAGGLMVTDSRVTHNQLTPSACENAKVWFEENAESILLDRKITKEKGIWVVTKTYTAKRRAVALLQTKGSSVVFGVNADLYAIGKIAPEQSWWNSINEQVWMVAQPKTEADDSIPMFMCGWFWRPTLFSRRPDPTAKKEKQRKTLGGDEDKRFEVELKEVIKLDLEKIGNFKTD